MSRRSNRQKSKRKNLLPIIILIVFIFTVSIYIVSRFKENNKRNLTSTSSVVSSSKLPGTIEPDIQESNNSKISSQPESGTAVENKAENKASDVENVTNVPEAKPIKANDKLVDTLLENYLNIYVNLSNDKELDFYYLDNVVYKDSSFYKSLVQEIEKTRQSNIKLTLDDFSIDKISNGSSDSELIIQVSQTISGKISKYSYTVYFDQNGVFIKERK